MASEQLIITLLSIFFAPSVLILSVVIFLAAIGKSFGLRKLYIQILLQIFEWGRHRIEKHESTGRIIDRQDGEGAGDLQSRAGGEPSLLYKEGASPRQKKVDEYHVIQKDFARQKRELRMRRLSIMRTIEDMQDSFRLDDSMEFQIQGMEAIIEDEVTQRFDAAELPSWNMLTRSNTSHTFISYRLTAIWFLGFVVRYIILFPFRLIMAVFGVGLLITGTAINGYLPDGKMKKWLNYRLSVTCYRIFARGLSASITFHNKERRAKGGGICVANHTSPIDIIILGCDNCYAMVGQAQGGFMGVIQRALSRAEHHIWFDRSEAKDRLAVARRLREHVEDTNKLPILIFPEGTCINNTSIMMFKKGSFEVGGTIYPVAIKYDPRFADAFWNSSKHTLLRHILMILTSWALVADVWYLPPEIQLDNETGLEFANRIKAEIAIQGGLVDLDWDGGLKRSMPKPAMKEKKQQEYSRRLKGE